MKGAFAAEDEVREVPSPGKDAWVVGDIDLVIYDILGDDRDDAKPTT